MRTRWYFKLRGDAYGLGPVGPMTKEDLKTYIRKWFGIKNRIPSGTQIWKLKPMG